MLYGQILPANYRTLGGAVFVLAAIPGLILAQTFLEVAAAGSLAQAARRLHVTQAAVSARLQTLEALLEQKLFVRNKAGARLTPPGRAFLPYALQLTQVWEQARYKVSTHADEVHA